MRVRIAAIVGVIAAGAVAFFVLRGRGTTEAKPERPPIADRATARVAREVETVKSPLQTDDDPPGNLRLEGQVIDVDDHAITGATVVVDSNPPREVKTEADGAFAFDGLTPRTYRLAARSGEASAGPVSSRLAQGTEPVILRVKKAGTIVVNVANEAGTALTGALVEVRDLVSITAVTDGDGRATLRGIAGGWHAIKASADGHASAFREVATTANGETRVAFTLKAGASISGTVVDGSGAAIEGARVLPEHLGHFDDLYDARYDAVLTDAKGRWRLTGLPRETTRIRAHHGEFAPGASSPIVLADGDRTDVTITLERGGRLKGRVVDASGAPVAGAEVRVSADTVLSGQVRRVAADARGQFEMAGLPRRTMYVMAASETARSKTVRVDVAASPPLELRLAEGGAIEGVVVTTSGKPVPEARVVAERARTASDFEQVEARLTGTESAIAGMDGRFRIAPLETGTYLVRAIRPGSTSDLLEMRLGVTVETGREVKIVVDDLSTVTGKIVRADGKPVTQFAIRLGMAPLRRFASTEGTFKVDDVPAGKQFIEISGADIVAHPLVDVMVESNRPTDLGTITVSSGRTIAGSIVDRSGRPIANAAVVIAREIHADGTTLVPFPDSRYVEVASGVDGRFAIRGVGHGMQQIAAEHPTAGRSLMTTIQPGTTDSELVLTLVEPGVVQGFVRLDGKPAEAMVVLRSEGAADSRTTVRTGADGSYRFDRVAPDRYTHIAVRILARKDEHSEEKSQRIDVRSGAVLEVNVDLTESGVSVMLHIGGSEAVLFGYGVIGVIDDPAITPATTTLPKTISEGRTLGTRIAKMSMREGMIVTQRQIKLDKVPAGRHVACISPLRGDPGDPSVLAELQRGAADWPLYCKWVTIASAPDPQHITVEVQPAPPPKP